MPRPSFWTPERVLLLVAVVTVAIYWRDLSHDFILDDVPLILMNPALATWRNLPMVFRSDIFHFPYVHITAGAIHYRPIYISWLLLNNAVFGMVLPWWHLMSLALHLAITFLVYRLGLKLLADRWQAVFAASIFALHPVHAEPVAYLTATDDLLVALFSLIALLLYFRFRERGRARDLVISVTCAAAAMLSKESAGMFPWLLVAWEALRAGRESGLWRRFRWTLPYFAIGAGYVLLRTALFGLNTGPGPGGSRLAVIPDIPLAALIYLRNFFLPAHLSFYYPPAWSTDWTWTKAALLAPFVVAAILIWLRHKDRGTVRLLLAWTAILFVPAAVALTTFIKDEWVHDRHVYLASAPACLLIAVLFAELLRQRRALAVASAVVIAALAVDSYFQVPRFQDEVSVYASALKIAPRNAALHRYYASALWKYNRRADALPEFRTAIALDPKTPYQHEDYAGALEELGEKSEALAEYKEALTQVPLRSEERPQLLYHVATLEIATSDLDDAAAHLHEAISMAPRALNYHAALADVLRKQGNPNAAEEALRVEAINRKEFLKRRKATRQ